MFYELLACLIMTAPLVASLAINRSANSTVNELSSVRAVEGPKVVFQNTSIVNENGTNVEIESYINIEGLLSEVEYEKYKGKVLTETKTEKPAIENVVPVVPYSIVDGPCADGMKTDSHGKCRQAL